MPTRSDRRAQTSPPDHLTNQVSVVLADLRELAPIRGPAEER
jgi:hypothetical protein